MKWLNVFFVLCLLLSNCTPPPATTLATDIIEDLRLTYAPDKRVARWLIQDSLQAGRLLLTGETNLPEAKNSLLERLMAAGVNFIDSIQLLPSDNLAGEIYGLVNVSVGNLRSEDKHWGEMASQVLLGTPLKIMKKVRDGWYYVQTPDGYLGYLDKGAFVLLDKKEFDKWQQASKVIYWKDFGFSTQTSDPESQIISDLVLGNLLELGTSDGTTSQVVYPDGRTAYVSNSDIRPMTAWLETADPSPAAFTETAKHFIGRPYLWGGTSGKGMDCSGFTKTVFFLHGLILQRDASQQVHTGLEIATDTSLSNIEKGDFLFFGRKATAEQAEKITHVGIYLGEGQFIHSGDDNPGIRIQSLRPGDPDFAPHRLAALVRARRMWAEPGAHGVQWVKASEFYAGQDLRK